MDYGQDNRENDMKTNIRKWALAATLGAAAAAAGSPASGAETTWKASIWFGKTVLTEPDEWFAKEAAAKTGGQLKIDITYPPSKPTESIDLVNSGAADIAFFCAAYHGDKMSLATVMDLPMFAPEDIQTFIRVEMALADHPAIQAELRKSNVKILFPMPLHQSQLMGTKRVARIDDFQGARIRIPPVLGKVLQEYGATTTIMSPPEAIAAMKAGTLDLISMPYPSVYAHFKAEDSSKYVIDNISLGSQFCFFGAGQKSWDALPAKSQQTLLNLRQAAMIRYSELYAREDAATVAMFKQKGLEFVTFNPTDRARLVARAIKHWQTWVDEREKQGLKGREVFEFTQAKIREFGRK